MGGGGIDTYLDLPLSWPYHASWIKTQVVFVAIYCGYPPTETLSIHQFSRQISNLSVIPFKFVSIMVKFKMENLRRPEPGAMCIKSILGINLHKYKVPKAFFRARNLLGVLIVVKWKCVPLNLVVLIITLRGVNVLVFFKKLFSVPLGIYEMW